MEGTGGGWMGGWGLLHSQPVTQKRGRCLNVAMAALALKSECFIADFDRQSSVKETQQLKQSEQNCLLLGGRNPHETQISVERRSNTQVF